MRAVQAPPAPPREGQEVRKGAPGRVEPPLREASLHAAGPKDAPLRSLFPEEPPRPQPVRLAWHKGWLCSRLPSSHADLMQPACVQQCVPSLMSLPGRIRSLCRCWRALQGAPKLKVAIIGSGLAGLSTAAELLDQGYDVDVYEQRPFIGGKVASYKDRDGNHIEACPAAACTCSSLGVRL